MEEGNGKFVRWQQVTLAQLGFVNSTGLALATASLGFSLTRAPSELPVYATTVAIALFLFSHLFAIWCAMNRLWDFRESTQLAKGDMTADVAAALRVTNKKRGAKTWYLLYAQLATLVWGFWLYLAAFSETRQTWFTDSYMEPRINLQMWVTGVVGGIIFSVAVFQAKDANRQMVADIFVAIIAGAVALVGWNSLPKQRRSIVRHSIVSKLPVFLVAVGSVVRRLGSDRLERLWIPAVREGFNYGRGCACRGRFDCLAF